MIPTTIRLAIWGGAALAAAAAEGLTGLGFLSQPVTGPLWAWMLSFALPMEALIALIMRVSGSKRYEKGYYEAPGETVKRDDRE